MSCRVVGGIVGLVGMSVAVLHAGTVTLRGRDVALSQALAEVRTQTGVTVVDARGEKDGPVSLNLDKVSFWQAVDAIALAARAKAVYGRDGGVQLVKLRPKEQAAPVSYDGDFRVRALSVLAKRDLDSDSGSCDLTLELTWTPTVRPLFVATRPHGVRIVDKKSQALDVEDEGPVLAAVEDKPGVLVDVSLPRPPRQQTHLGSVEGKILAVVPSKFLSFTYAADLAALKDAVADGAVRRLVQDDVTCRIERVVEGKDRWSIQVGLEYPAGARVLESFQASAMVVHNELVLMSGDGKRRLVPSEYVVDSVSSRRARVTYHFRDRPEGRLGALREWKPRYRAAARIVDVPVSFRFRDVALP